MDEMQISSIRETCRKKRSQILEGIHWQISNENGGTPTERHLVIVKKCPAGREILRTQK